MKSILKYPGGKRLLWRGQQRGQTDAGITAAVPETADTAVGLADQEQWMNFEPCVQETFFGGETDV